MQITFNPMPTIQPNAVKLIAAQRRIDHITACSSFAPFAALKAPDEQVHAGLLPSGFKAIMVTVARQKNPATRGGRV